MSGAGAVRALSRLAPNSLPECTPPLSSCPASTLQCEAILTRSISIAAGTITDLEALRRRYELDLTATEEAAAAAGAARAAARRLGRELAERGATLELAKAEAVSNAARAARSELKQLASAARAAEAGAAVGKAAKAAAATVRGGEM